MRSRRKGTRTWRPRRMVRWLPSLRRPQARTAQPLSETGAGQAGVSPGAKVPGKTILVYVDYNAIPGAYSIAGSQNPVGSTEPSNPDAANGTADESAGGGSPSKPGIDTPQSAPDGFTPTFGMTKTLRLKIRPRLPRPAQPAGSSMPRKPRADRFSCQTARCPRAVISRPRKSPPQMSWPPRRSGFKPW